MMMMVMINYDAVADAAGSVLISERIEGFEAFRRLPKSSGGDNEETGHEPKRRSFERRVRERMFERPGDCRVAARRHQTTSEFDRIMDRRTAIVHRICMFTQRLKPGFHSNAIACVACVA